jgi:hypothetical protein
MASGPGVVEHYYCVRECAWQQPCAIANPGSTPILATPCLKIYTAIYTALITHHACGVVSRRISRLKILTDTFTDLLLTENPYARENTFLF